MTDKGVAGRNIVEAYLRVERADLARAGVTLLPEQKGEGRLPRRGPGDEAQSGEKQSRGEAVGGVRQPHLG